MTRILDGYLRRPALQWMALVALLAGAVIRTVLLPNQPPTPYRIDIDVYRTGAQVFLDGGDLYGQIPPLSQGTELPFTYPPIAAIGFVVFAIMPLWVASALLTVASIATLGMRLHVVLASVLERARREVAWIAVAFTAALLWLSPVRETLDFGQINILLMVICLVDAIAGRGRWWGGTLVGLAIAIKLTPIVFFLLFFLRRDWRAMLTGAASFLAFTGLGFLVMPSASVEYWTSTLSNTDRIGDPGYAANQSINGLLARFQIDSGLVWFLVAVVVGLFCGYVAWRLLQQGHHAAAVLAVAASALFCSPVSWTHHWVWVVPLLALFIAWGTPIWWGLAALGGLVHAVAPHKIQRSREGIETTWVWWEHILGNAYLLWLLLALLLLLFVRPPRPSGGEAPTA